MPFLGMDVESTRMIGDSCEAASVQVAAFLEKFDAGMPGGEAWSGADAEEFRLKWRGETRIAIGRLATMLVERGQVLREQSAEQERTSAGDADVRLPEDLVFVADLYRAAPAEGGSGPDPTAPGDAGSHAVTQEDADRILKDYQVEDDEVVVWGPLGGTETSGSGSGTFTRKMTRREAELLSELGLGEFLQLYRDQERAWEETAERYGDENGEDPHPVPQAFNDDHGDAFRHAYVNALTVRNTGEEWAEDFWTAHEAVPGNLPAREAMDLYNNEVGRRIAVENPDASPDELADLVEQAVADGEMVVIDAEGRLVPSNSVSPDETGG